MTEKTTGKKKYTKRILGIALFIAVITGICYVSQLLFANDGSSESVLLQGFYLEEPDSLDIVVMGASEIMNDYCAPEMYREHGYLIDTHTAVAYKVYQDYVKETGDETPALIASTASAYKFAESVAKSIGLPDRDSGFAYIEDIAKETGVRVPKALKDLDKKEIRHRGVITIDEMAQAVEDSVK